MSMRVLVTGGNQGIGFALCKQLALEHDCHVLLSARSQQKGMDAVSEIESAIGTKPGCKGSVNFLKLDTSDDNSVASAAATFSATFGNEKGKAATGTLGAIVNNAGIGLNTGTGNTGDILNTNLYGPKRVCDHFAPFLETNGRIVNVGSGMAAMYVGSLRSQAGRALLCSGASGIVSASASASTSASNSGDAVTWEKIERYANDNFNESGEPYGLSKALVACYTGVLARQYPHLLVSCCTPGFINTQMTTGYGSSKPPEEGTLAIRKCLFETLEHGSGWYYGSDGVRSQYHFMRNPGEPEYDGVNPYL